MNTFDETTPTPEDLQKYKQCATRILLDGPWHNPTEVRITQVLNDGTLIQVTTDFGQTQWLRTSDTKVLYIFPTPLQTYRGIPVPGVAPKKVETKTMDEWLSDMLCKEMQKITEAEEKIKKLAKKKDKKS